MGSINCLDVLDILIEYSDEEHYLTYTKISYYLKKEKGVSMGWKGIKTNIEKLGGIGVEIDKYRAGNTYYFSIKDRYFSMPELFVLLDGVHSNHSLPIELSKKLTNKLLKTRSCHERSHLRRFLFYTGSVKYSNMEFFNNMEILNNAIDTKHRIQFVYLTWNTDKELVPMHRCDYLSATPVLVVLKNEKYYLVAWNESIERIRHYRVDKLSHMAILDEASTVNDEINRINQNKEDYVKKNFSMFGGEESMVVLEGHKYKVGILLDQLGTDISILKLDDNRFRAYVNVAVSREFFGWIDSLEGDIVIVGPESVKTNYMVHLDTIYKPYR